MNNNQTFGNVNYAHVDICIIIIGYNVPTFAYSPNQVN